MGYFVSNNTLQLIAVKLLQQPGGNSDGGSIGVSPRGKGIQCRVVDDIDIRHLFQSRGNLHFLDSVVQTGMIVAAYLPRSGYGENNAVPLEIGNQTHDHPYHQSYDQAARAATE